MCKEVYLEQEEELICKEVSLEQVKAKYLRKYFWNRRTY